MKRLENVGLLLVLFAVSLIATGYLISCNLIIYAIVSGALALVLLVSVINMAFNSKNEEAVYKSDVRNILKTYDSILVKSINVPELKKKNIIKVETFDDLINAQIEIRKPIYYVKEENCCSFLLLGDEACVYTIKMNDSVVSKVEEKIKKIESKRKKHNEEVSLLDNIEHTMIIRLENLKSYKVSPIKEEEDVVES